MVTIDIGTGAGADGAMREPIESSFGRVKRVHPHQWLWEPLEGEPSFVLRAMFGAKAVYLDGKIMFCFSAGDEPWRGMLVCTDHARHAALRADFPALTPHPILPKWLYLPEAADAFERTAAALVALARRRDPRIGVIPKPRKPPKKLTTETLRHGDQSPAGLKKKKRRS